MKDNTKNDKKILLNFLKSGLSTRELDEQLGHNSKKSHGWKSWDALKKYNLQASDKGKLFCFREQQSLAIIKEVIDANNREEVEKILNDAKPKYLDKYSNAYIEADSGRKVYEILSGEIRNITRDFFAPLKKFIGVCQYENCKNTNLDTVHLKKSRPDIFKQAYLDTHSVKARKYNIYQIMKQYIQLHSKKGSICFLCKKHHEELTRHEKTGGGKLKNFKKGIKSNI